MRVIARGGAYCRVADPAWDDPLDPSFAALFGGRWNPPGLAALYLNASPAVALANARRHVRERWAASLDDVRPELLPDLQLVTVRPGGRFLDAVTPDGIAELGLAASYPRDVPHPPCQGLGAAAQRDGLDGVAALSAVAPEGEELVVFGDAIAKLVARGGRTPFSAWSRGATS